jgi:hypothetical protein
MAGSKGAFGERASPPPLWRRDREGGRAERWKAGLPGKNWADEAGVRSEGDFGLVRPPTPARPHRGGGGALRGQFLIRTRLWRMRRIPQIATAPASSARPVP